MPKLPKKIANEVAKSEEWGTGSQLLEEGRYAARLMKVEEREGRVAPQWSWWLTKPHDANGKQHNRTLFLNTSLSDKAFGRLKQVFHAFGYSPDSDTDEIIGEWVGVYVTQEVQTQGKNAGKTQNRVEYVFEFDADEWEFDPEQVEEDAPRNAPAGDDDTF